LIRMVSSFFNTSSFINNCFTVRVFVGGIEAPIKEVEDNLITLTAPPRHDLDETKLVDVVVAVIDYQALKLKIAERTLHFLYAVPPIAISCNWKLLSDIEKQKDRDRIKRQKT
jgi:hypothetical protein